MAHRQFVFTIPKRLRIRFRFDRRLPGQLCPASWAGIRTVLQLVCGRPEPVPGMIGAVQTFGDLIHWHPHIHAPVTAGVFLPDGTFVPLPKLASEDHLAGPKRSFQVFDPLDFLPEVTQHVPDAGVQLIRYNG